MTEETRPGHYLDSFGQWQPDRRKTPDRRALAPLAHQHDHERRRVFRRKADREIFEKDHRAMIEEALQDFASEHDGHL